MAVGNASMRLRGVTLYGSKRLHHPYARSRRNPRCYIRTLIVATACKFAAVERHRHNHVHAVEKSARQQARMQTSAPCRRQSADCCGIWHLLESQRKDWRDDTQTSTPHAPQACCRAAYAPHPDSHPEQSPHAASPPDMTDTPTARRRPASLRTQDTTEGKTPRQHCQSASSIPSSQKSSAPSTIPAITFSTSDGS